VEATHEAGQKSPKKYSPCNAGIAAVHATAGAAQRRVLVLAIGNVMPLRSQLEAPKRSVPSVRFQPGYCSARREIDLLARFLADVADVRSPVASAEAEGISQAIALCHARRRSRGRIAAALHRACAVDVDTEDLAERRRQALTVAERIALAAAVAEADESRRGRRRDRLRCGSGTGARGARRCRPRPVGWRMRKLATCVSPARSSS
jgi:hypothetical protein